MKIVTFTVLVVLASSILITGHQMAAAQQTDPIFVPITPGAAHHTGTITQLALEQNPDMALPHSSDSNGATDRVCVGYRAGAPQLDATAGHTEVTLKWKVPDRGGCTLQKYVILGSTGDDFRQISSFPAYTRIGTIECSPDLSCNSISIGAPNPNDYRTLYITLTNLGVGQEYKFKVYATSTHLAPGYQSNEVTVKTLGAPGVPKNLEGTYELKSGPDACVLINSFLGGSLQSSSCDATIKLSWGPPDDDGGSPITGYGVVARINNTGPLIDYSSLYTTTTTNLSVDIKMTKGVPYEYGIFAINALGNGMPTDTVTMMYTSVPGAPGNFTGTASDGTVTLSWDPPADNGGSQITDYEISARIGNINPLADIATVPATQTSHTIDNLMNGIEYEFVVRGNNSVGDGHVSDLLVLTPAALPEAPSNLMVQVNTSTFTISWDEPSNISDAPVTQYVIESVANQTTSSGYNIDEYSVSGDTTSITIPRLANAHYIITVYAVNQTGQGPPSDAYNYNGSSGPK